MKWYKCLQDTFISLQVWFGQTFAKMSFLRSKIFLKYVFVAESFHLLHKDITFVAYLEIFIFYQCTTLRKFVWALYIDVLNLSSIYPIFAHNHKEPHM